ncbi:MAG TPA: hypothetical protein P5105_04245, partial [Victivallales bacterium]|nr:hypothetical protein [Victivallales bacterium]
MNILKKFIIIAIFATANIIFAQVKVVKEAKDRNPSLLFSGIVGNSELSAAVESDLRNCGWFDLVSQSSAEYVVNGGAAGRAVQVNARKSNGTVISTISITIDDSRRTAHAIVDKILQDIFGIKGICSAKIAFCAELSKGVKEIYISDFDGQGIVQITRSGTLNVEPEWLPNKSGIVFTQYSKMYTDVVEYNIASRRSRRLAQFPGLNSGAAISPNGQLLAMILSKDRQVELYIKSFNGGEHRRLTNSKSVEASPAWSPDGSKICYVSDQSGRPQLYLISAGGGNSIKLQTMGVESVNPAWSGDNKIAYSSKYGNNYVIVVYDLTGKEA